MFFPSVSPELKKVIEYINKLKEIILKYSKEDQKAISHYISLIIYDSKEAILELDFELVQKVEISLLMDKFKSDCKKNSSDF